MMRATAFAAVLAALMAATSTARAEVKTREIEYRQGETPLQGFLAWDDAAGKRPGVVVIHEWWGHNQHARNQAIRLAREGYVAFALDMYGKGKVTTHPKDAQAFAAEATKDPQVVAARFDAALKVLEAQPQVDAGRMAAVGYCFGGGVALRMARVRPDLKAVATFHPGIPPPEKTAPGRVKARILILAGGADPMVPAARVEAFEKEMKAAGAHIEVVTFPGAKHGFTNPDAGKAGMDGLAYDAEADRASWVAAVAMLRQALR
jgi:dienelactone hydrolase